MRPIADERSDSDAVVNARNRISVIRGSLGTKHPEYASALNQLALLLIIQGDAVAAEPLLREALDVRRTTLGENHPDFATNLSSLGGILWAKGDLDAAEPLLKKAAEVRRATLGPTHPKSIVSLNSLDQLQKSRKDWRPSRPPIEKPIEEEPAPVETPSAPIRIPTRISEPTLSPALPTSLGLLPERYPMITEPVVRVTPAAATGAAIGSADWLLDQANELARDFSALAELLNSSARRLLEGEPIPAEEIRGRSQESKVRFSSLGKAVAEAHEVLGRQAPERLDSLERIKSCLPELKATEAARLEWKEIRDKARGVLERVGRLMCPSSPNLEALNRCRRQAEDLVGEANANGHLEPSETLKRLAFGEHPFLALLSMVGANETTDDAEWADWYEAVEKAFGNAIAIAAARSRLTEAEAEVSVPR